MIDYEKIIEKAFELYRYRDCASGIGGQMITMTDTFDYYVILATKQELINIAKNSTLYSTLKELQDKFDDIKFLESSRMQEVRRIVLSHHVEKLMPDILEFMEGKEKNEQHN